MAKTLHHFINGKLVEGTSGRFGDVFNPATGEKSAQVPLASAAEVGEAVAAAKAAFPAWAATPPLQRARILFKFKQLVEANLDKHGGAGHRRARQDPQRRQGLAAPAASRSSSSPAASRSC